MDRRAVRPHRPVRLLSRPVGLVSRVSPESVVPRDNYHTYAMKDGEV